MSYELRVALRYLRARRKQAFISLITLLSMAGVGLGVCALIVVLSVMSGFEGQLKAKILGLNAHVMIFEAGKSISGFRQALQKAEADPEVVAATPFVYGQVMVLSDAAASGAILRGMDLPGALKVLDIKHTIIKGSLQGLEPTAPGAAPGVVLGSALARRVGARVGDLVNLVNPVGEDTPVGRVPKSEPFKVVGVFESGMYQYDSSLIYTGLAAARSFMGLGDAVTGIEMRVKDLYRADVVGRRVAGKLGPLFYSRDWMSTNHSLFSALKLEKITMFVILTLIVLVAAFGIISSLIMLVMEKQKDIAILKAMGATARSVGRIFMLEGLIIGVCGTVGGVATGLGLCALLARYHFIELPKDVYAISTLPVQVEPMVVGLVALCAVAISLLATIYPARAAGALDVVEAIRYQ